MHGQVIRMSITILGVGTNQQGTGAFAASLRSRSTPMFAALPTIFYGGGLITLITSAANVEPVPRYQQRVSVGFPRH
jgi:hypothetical protein